MKKSRIKATATAYVAQTREDVIADIRVIGDTQREIERLQADMNDELAQVTDKYALQFEGLKSRLITLQDGVQRWCEANRDVLTNNGKIKTANLITGDVSWRQRPPSVAVRGADSVIETLRNLNLERFIRVKEEINKEAILNEPETLRGIAGVTIKTGVEDFIITPFEQQAD